MTGTTLEIRNQCQISQAADGNIKMPGNYAAFVGQSFTLFFPINEVIATRSKMALAESR